MNKFSQRFTENSGIVSLMEDLGDALNHNRDMIFMGGGNPATLPEVEETIAQLWRELAQDPAAFHKLVGEYQPPQGDPACLEALAGYLQDTCGWPVSPENIAVGNGAQSIFFTLFNMLGNNEKKILLPLVPDYLGYVDSGLDRDMFYGVKPAIREVGNDYFKYAIDFPALPWGSDIGAVCLSRPTNPSGNIVTDDELRQLKVLCQQHQVPLIVDLAYGQPFPNATFVDHQLHWDTQTIAIMSLSKIGLPGMRTGFIVADKAIIKQFSRATASLSLAPGNTGPALLKRLIDSGELSRLANQVVQPFYGQKRAQITAYIEQKIQHLPVRLHQAEGAFFVWLWFKSLPISSQELYERLKTKGVFVLSGHHFFQALDDKAWPHQHECLRLSYCAPWDRLKEGLDILFAEIERLYSRG